MHFKCNQKIDSFILFKLMKNFRGSALAAGVGTPESVPHELLGSSLRFYLVFKHRNYFKMNDLPENTGKYLFKNFMIGINDNIIKAELIIDIMSRHESNLSNTTKM